MSMTREMAIPYISYVLNDALNDLPISALQNNATLVGWQCGFEPLFVAVQSYLPDTIVDADEAIEIATDWLEEIDWFSDVENEDENYRDPDYVILGKR